MSETPLSGSAFTAAAKYGWIGWIERRPVAAFGAFLALHFAVWTALPTLLYANLPLDLIEALTYGRDWQLGYDKLPPLPWWLVEVMYRSFGTDAAYYALAQVEVLIAFAAVWAIARPLTGATGALIAVLIIDGMHYFQYTAVKFNHDVTELPFWALAGYTFHAALTRGRLHHWALFGFVLGAALWAKYFVIVLATPFTLFLLFDARARRALATPGPWVAIAVAFIIMAPHLLWLIHTDFLPFAYANARSAPMRGWYDHVLHPAEFVGNQIFFLLPTFIITAALLWPRPKTTALAASAQRGSGYAADDYDRRIVTLLAFGPGLTMIALTAVTGRGTVSMWGYPLWIYLGLWIVLTTQAVLDRDRITRVVTTWAAIFAIFAVGFVVNYGVLPSVDHRYRAVLFPGERLSGELSERFHDATGKPLRYVIGSMWDAGNVAHYSPEQPQILIDGQPRRAPWIDLDDLRAKGALLVWTRGESAAPLPTQFAAIAANAEVGTPFTLPMLRGDGEVYVNWAILKPQ